MVLIQVKEQGKIKKTLWTADGRGRKKSQGWDNAGIRRYNELVNVARKIRGSWPVEDKIYLQKKRQEKQELKSDNVKRRRESLVARK